MRKTTKKSNAISKKTLVKKYAIMTLSFLILILSITFAWLAINRRTEAEAMELNTDVSPNMIISDTLTGFDSIDEDDVPNMFSTTFNSGLKTLSPATHFTKESYKTGAGEDEKITSSSTGLVYVKNKGAVSSSTGYALAGNTLYFGEAVNDDKRDFYFDYVVYIASYDAELPIDSLVASIEEVKADGEENLLDLDANISYKAASIDFYISKSTDEIGTFIGTLNIANVDSTDYTQVKNSIELFDENTIPQNTDGYVRVTMRVYIDGDLNQNATTAYVNSDQVTIEKLGIKVHFEGIEPTI